MTTGYIIISIGMEQNLYFLTGPLDKLQRLRTQMERMNSQVFFHVPHVAV